MSEMIRRLSSDVTHLADEIGPRPPGTVAEAAAAEWIADRFRSLGLETRLDSVPGPSHTATTAAIDLCGSDTSFDTVPSLFSASGDVRGALCHLRGDLTDHDPEVLRGKIGLWMPCGGLKERIRGVLHAQEAGLLGLVVGSPHMDQIQTKMVREPELDKMPVAAVSWRSARALCQHVGDEVRLKVAADPEQAATSRNVIATIPGRTENWLVVSAHHDTAPYAPGATDNAGGVAALLELARRLQDAEELDATVYLVSTAAEEYGRTDGVGAGAQAFIDTQRESWLYCLGWLEIDDIGNPLGTPSLFLGGPKPFRDIVKGEEMPEHMTFPGKPSVGCDHGAAEQRGIPVAWYTDSCGAPRPHYHTPADRTEFFDAERAGSYISCVLNGVCRLAATVPVDAPIVGDGRLMRQARHEDIPAVVEITRAAYGSVSGDCMAETFFGEQLGGRPWHEYKCAEIERAMRDNIYRFIVTEVNSNVIGFASFLTDPRRGIASIGNNAVHPDWQDRGIGGAQQREIDRRMRQEGYSRFKVVTLSNDFPAQNMYERLGYDRISETINYLRRSDRRG